MRRKILNLRIRRAYCFTFDHPFSLQSLLASGAAHRFLIPKEACYSFAGLTPHIQHQAPLIDTGTLHVIPLSPQPIAQQWATDEHVHLPLQQPQGGALQTSRRVMADPVLGSVAGVLGATVKCSIALTEFLIAVREAPRDILALQIELKAIESVLGELQSSFTSRNWAKPPSQKWITDLESILDWCMDIILELSVLVKKLKSDASSSWGGRTWKSIRWTFIEGDVKKLRDRLESAKNTLGLKLQSLSTVVGMRVEGRVEEIHGGLGQMQSMLQQLVAEQIVVNQEVSEKAFLAKQWGIPYGDPPNHQTPPNFSNQPSHHPNQPYPPNLASPQSHYLASSSYKNSSPNLHSYSQTIPYSRAPDYVSAPAPAPAWPAPPPPPFPPRSIVEFDQTSYATSPMGNRPDAQRTSQSNIYQNSHIKPSPGFYEPAGLEVYEAPPAPIYNNQGRFKSQTSSDATPWRTIGSFEFNSNIVNPTWKGKDSVTSMPQDQGCLYIGIHLGSHSSSVYYSFIGNNSTVGRLINEWPGLGSILTSVVPNVVYYDRLLNIVGWGHDTAGALEPSGYLSSVVSKVEDFVTLLPMPDNMTVPGLPSLPVGKTRTDILADFLINLFGAVKAWVRGLDKSFQPREYSEVRYIFAVPASWDETAMQKAHTAAINAGILFGDNDSRLTIVKETEAVIFDCVESNLLRFAINDIVLVVNCGRVFSNFIAYRVDQLTPSSFSISEFTKSTGEACGSSTVSLNFSSLVRYRMDSSSGLSSLDHTYPKVGAKIRGKCILDFESRIKADFRNNGQKWAVDLDLDEDMYDEPAVDGIEEGYLVFNNDEILRCFEPVIYRIYQHIMDQLEAIYQRGGLLRKIVVMGEFDEYTFLFEEIQRAVAQNQIPPQTVVRLRDPSIAVPRGAVAAFTLDVYGTGVARNTALTRNIPPPKVDNSTSTQHEEIDEAWLKHWNSLNKR